MTFTEKSASKPPMRKILLLPLAVTLAGLPLSEAAAQYRTMGGAANPQWNDQQRRPAPSALPGMAGRQAPLPIPGDPTKELSPNAALFDAINRGDLAAARESMARGADLSAHNVLGLTPIDAAVDQGRNEIVFYLLSVRSSAPGSRGAPEDDAVLRGRQPRPTQRQAQQQRQPAPAPVPAATAAAPATANNPPRSQTPHLFARDGGNASPNQGFLGFDAGGTGTATTQRGQRGG